MQRQNPANIAKLDDSNNCLEVKKYSWLFVLN